jgi:hypothetical protein
MSKSLFFFPLFIIFSFTSLHGQISIGAKAGLNLATFGVDESVKPDGQSYLTGFNAGILANLELNDRFSIQPEFVYTQKGIKAITYNIVQAYKLNYIEAPLLGKFIFGKKAVRGYLISGLSFGFALNAKYVAKIDGKEITREKIEFDNDIEDGYADNRFDIGFIIGSGIQFAQGLGNFFVDIRYNMSLNSIERFKEDPKDYSKTRNKVIMISAGYLIPFN